MNILGYRMNRLGMSNEELAEVTGLSRKTIDKIRNKRVRRVNSYTAWVLNDFFGEIVVSGANISHNTGNTPLNRRFRKLVYDLENATARLSHVERLI